MHPLISDETAGKAAQILSRNDPIMAAVIARYGICPVRPHSEYYESLVDSIIGQQLSVKAAASIRKRFDDHFGGHCPSPSQILATDVDELRTLGLSRAKATYVRDLAQRLLDGGLEFSRFDELSNADIIKELTAVKGVGEWTAHMFLMFCMGRTDVLPYGDLGIRNGIAKLYSLPAAPDKAAVERVASDNHWHPYESIASWYVWQSLDNAPAIK